jgi:hypothetical protein
MLCAKALVVISLLLAAPATVGAIPTVYCEPETVTVDSAEVFRISVMVTGLDTLSNYQVIFTYDCSVLEYIKAYEGSLYANSGLQTWFEEEVESLCTYEVWDVIFPALTYLLPPGELCILEFRALGAGFSPIEFLSVALTDRYREGIDPLTWRDGLVVVGDMAGVDDAGTGGAGRLGPPRPNPTCGGVHIPLVLPGRPGAMTVSADVYDSRGRLVACLEETAGVATAGLKWDGCDSAGRKVPAGVYYVRASDFPGTARKVILIR